MMTFIPVDRPTAACLRDGTVLRQPFVGNAATPGLIAELGLDSGPSEEANFQAQTYAMVAGLIAALWSDGNRVVLAADVPDGSIRDDDETATGWGSVRVENLAWDWVTAVFSDGTEPEPDVSAAVRIAADRVRGDGLPAALVCPEVERLIDAHDLLWHVPDEPW